jgi:hypothetical protein
MEINQLLDKLKELQLEQDKIIKDIASITSTQPDPPKEDLNRIRIGDHVKLLTGGLKCKKGDIAEVTSVSPSSISFIVLRNSHRTYRKPKNLQKVLKRSQK